jgi:hypothetical protein
VVGGRREATRVLEIVASRSGGLATLLRVTADGTYREDGWLHFRSAQDPLLYTVAVPGVMIRQDARTTVRVNHPALDEVVVSSGQDGGERGVVLELHLGSPEVTVSRVTSRGPHLVVELVAPGGSGGQGPTSQQTTRTTTTTGTTSAATSPAGPGDGPVQAAPGTAGRLLELATRRDSDGSTLITITADGPIPALRHRHIRVSDEPPRDVISIVGVDMPDAPPLIPVDDACLRSIKVVHRADQTPQAVHLVLNLTSPEVRHEEVAGRDDQIIVRLLPPGSSR